MYERLYLAQETWPELQVEWPEPGGETVHCRMWAAVLDFGISEAFWMRVTPLEN